MPDAIGVPLIVITFAVHAAETPAGKPFAPATPLLEIPVAPVVACVIFVNAVLMHKFCVVLAAPTAVSASPVMVHPLPPLTVAKTKLALAAVANGP